MIFFFLSSVLAKPPYIDYAYSVTLVQMSQPPVNVNVSFAKNPQGHNVATVSSGFQQPYYPYDFQLYNFVSDNDTLQGTMAWFEQTGLNVSSQNCHWIFNQSLADMFDLSSTGWLSRANVTVVGAQTLYTWDCSPNCLTSNLQSTYTYFGNGFYILTVDRTGEFLALTSASSSAMQFLFATKPQKLSSITLDVPNACVESDRCPANETQTNLIIYRNHGNSTLFKSLDNVNLADLQGEVYWLCDYNAPSPLISKFNLTVSPRWTQYMLCNRGVCDASNYGQRYGIGKQDNEGFDFCEDAPQSNKTCFSSCGGVGTWYAFPVLGRCPPGKPIGTNKCTWLDKYTTMKTITLDCLRNVSYNMFSCYNRTVIDLQNDMLKAFNVCPDVQQWVGYNVKRGDVDEHEAVLPAIRHHRAPKKHKEQQPDVHSVTTSTVNTVAMPTAAPEIK